MPRVQAQHAVLLTHSVLSSISDQGWRILLISAPHGPIINWSVALRTSPVVDPTVPVVRGPSAGVSITAVPAPPSSSGRDCVCLPPREIK